MGQAVRTVTFHVDLPDGGVADEEQLAGADDLGLAQRDYFEGGVTLVLEAGRTLEISDELEPWVQNLCLGAVPKLLKGEHVEILYFSKGGRLHLDPDGEEVRISGDRTSDLVVERDSLVRELLAAGERFLALMRDLKAGDERYMQVLDDLDAYGQAARAALAANGG